MAGIMIVLLTVLCVLLYVGQSFGNRLFAEHYSGAPSAASPVFSVLYGIVVGIVTFFLNGCRFHVSNFTWLFGIGNGVVLFLFNLGMIKAAKCGPYSTQNIIMLFGSICINFIFSVLFWKDGISFLRVIGIVVMLVSFVVLNGGKIDFSGAKKQFFIWCAIIFLSNGVYGVLMDAQQRLVTDQRNEMIIITFLACAVISLAYLAFSQKSGFLRAFKMNAKTYAYAGMSSICATFAVVILMLLLTKDLKLCAVRDHKRLSACAWLFFERIGLQGKADKASICRSNAGSLRNSLSVIVTNATEAD